MPEESINRISIRFIIEGLGQAHGELVRYLAPRTIDSIVKKLPLEGRAALWKEEVYFRISLKLGEEKAVSIVERGAIAFWPMGNALCIFYGESQPYSPVNKVGTVTKNLKLFKQVKSGTKIMVEKI